MNKDEAPDEQLPVIYLARHGEKAWTLTGQHRGMTGLPLTETGERNAGRLGSRLRGIAFAKVFTSPRQRAVRTCELAGFGAIAGIDSDLVEWNYGEYEGRTGAEIRTARPEWHLFRDGCPGGESPQQAACRADRIIQRVRAMAGDVLLFTSGHFIRVLACRWIGIEPSVNARSFMLSTASLSALGYEHDLSRPVIRLWNDTHHVYPEAEKESVLSDVHHRRYGRSGWPGLSAGVILKQRQLENLRYSNGDKTDPGIFRVSAIQGYLETPRPIWMRPVSGHRN